MDNITTYTNPQKFPGQKAEETPHNQDTSLDKNQRQNRRHNTPLITTTRTNHEYGDKSQHQNEQSKSLLKNKRTKVTQSHSNQTIEHYE